MIRVRLTKRGSVATSVLRQRSPDSPPRPEPRPVVVEGVLGMVAQADGPRFEPRPAASLEEGLQYDQPVVLLLDEPSDSGRRRWWVSSPIRLVTVADRAEFWPLTVETTRSEYLIMVL